MQRSARAASRGTGPDLPPDLVLVPARPLTVPRGSPADRAAGIIAAQLALGDRAATAVFGALTGREITLDPAGPGFTRLPAGDEAKALRLRPGEELYVREGILRAGTVHCASVILKLAYQRVCQLTSGSTWGQIRSGIPAGIALGPHGLIPGHRRIEVIPGGNPAVRAWRVSTIRAVPVLISAEDVPESLCQRLAAGL